MIDFVISILPYLIGFDIADWLDKRFKEIINDGYCEHNPLKRKET